MMVCLATDGKLGQLDEFRAYPEPDILGTGLAESVTTTRAEHYAFSKRGNERGRNLEYKKPPQI